MKLSNEPFRGSQNAPAHILRFHVKRTYADIIPLALSLCIHLIIFAMIVFLLKQTTTKTVTADSENTSVRVTLAPPQQPPVKQEEAKPEPSILTTDRKDNTFTTSTKPPEPAVEETQPTNLERFLPRSNSEYLQQLRQEAHNPKDITADGGDIPIRGRERRRDTPMIVDRFEHRDMSLFQFSQMFHERFGAIWNAQERWVPPESPLRPGDVIYYKIYINPDGTLDHFENLTNKIKPNLNTEDLDKIFATVIAQALPMKLPAKLEKNVQVTEVLAIQVVNKTLFMNFGGQ